MISVRKWATGVLAAGAVAGVMAGSAPALASAAAPVARTHVAGPSTWLVKTASGKEMLQGRAGTVTRLGGLALKWNYNSAKRIEQVIICLINAPSGGCITSQGAGNQLKVETTGTSNWTVFVVGAGATYQMQSVNNKYCIREKNDNSVIGENTGGVGCPGFGNDPATEWIDLASRMVANSILANNAHSSDNMCTFGDTNGKPIWGDPPGESGEWNSWGGIKN